MIPIEELKNVIGDSTAGFKQTKARVNLCLGMSDEENSSGEKLQKLRHRTLTTVYVKCEERDTSKIRIHSAIFSDANGQLLLAEFIQHTVLTHGVIAELDQEARNSEACLRRYFAGIIL